MRRRHHGEACIRRLPNAISDAQTLGIDGDRHYVGAGQPQRLPRHEVAWVLQPHAVAAPKQYACDQRQGSLVTGGYDDLPGRADNPAGGRQIGSDRLAQWRVTGRLGIGHRGGTQRPRLARCQAAPKLAGKGVERRHAQPKQRHIRWSGLGPVGVAQCGLRRPRGNDAAGQLRRDDAADRTSGHHVSLAHQERVAGIHGASGYPQQARQAARRRQALARSQRPRGNGVAHALIALPMNRHCRGAIQADGRRLRRGRHGPAALSSLGPRH
jgi:hypothetical protein